MTISVTVTCILYAWGRFMCSAMLCSMESIDTYLGVVDGGHVLRRFGLSYLTHHFPMIWVKVAMEKMTKYINTFGPVLINDRFISYMLADHS